MKIGNIQFPDRPLFLAPMEDVTDIGFRMLCKRFGAQMVYTEFVSAEALIRSIKSTVNKLNIADEERPVGIQIYGRDTEAVVEAAKIVEDQAHPDVIDLNFGCPVKKVAGKGAGAGMLQNLPKLLDRKDKTRLECRRSHIFKAESRKWKGTDYRPCRSPSGLWHSGSHNTWQNTRPNVHR